MGRREQTMEHSDALQSGLLDIGRASKASGVSVKMIRHYRDVSKMLISYYRDPEAVMEVVRADLYE